MPHEIFVEMDELRGEEWQEQARWIKFEEHLLDGADRWGRAHIASLSFHSVINLRLVLEECKTIFVKTEIMRSLMKIGFMGVRFTNLKILLSLL